MNISWFIRLTRLPRVLRTRHFPFIRNGVRSSGMIVLMDRARNCMLMQFKRLNTIAINNLQVQWTSMNMVIQSLLIKHTTMRRFPSLSTILALYLSLEKGSKRKYAEGVERVFMDTMGNYCDTSNENFGQIAETMGKITKCVGSEYDNRMRCEQVYDALGAI
ncbi:hypothetical protein ACS0TY_010892 [Phlomoides rotata]